MAVNCDYDFYDLDLNTRKLCSYSVIKSEKLKSLLAKYYFSLNEEEQARFREFSARYRDFSICGGKKYKITRNSILIAERVKSELNEPCYPFIDKIATKGWSTRGGTFSWCIKRLKGNAESEICSFDAASMVSCKKYKLYINTYNCFLMLTAENEERSYNEQ